MIQYLYVRHLIAPQSNSSIQLLLYDLTFLSLFYFLILFLYSQRVIGNDSPSFFGQQPPSLAQNDYINIAYYNRSSILFVQFFAQ